MNQSSHLWLSNRQSDLIFFHVSAIFFLLFLLPYHWWGTAAIFPIYNVYLILFGLPHNYLTWAAIFPSSAQKSFRTEPMITAGIVCGVISLLIPLTRGQDLNDWILSFISYYSLWHAYRQHHGIAKIYDLVQMKRTGDQTLLQDRSALNLFFGLASFTVVIWAFTHARIDYLLSSEESYRLIYPQVSQDLFIAYCVFTAGVGLYAFKRTIWDRSRRGVFVPWPQISLMGFALATYILPYCFLPIEAMPLAVAIATMFHNFQYFGFVWMFEKYRSEDMKLAGIELQLPQRLAAQNSWSKYFTLALIYSVLVVIVYLVTPKQVGLTFIYFLALSHYIIDGYMWRRDINKSVGGFVAALAGNKNATSTSPSVLS